MSIKFQNPYKEERYADCEACNERYWGDDIDIYIREVSSESESFSVCSDCRWGRTKFVRHALCEALKKSNDPSVKRLREGEASD